MAKIGKKSVLENTFYVVRFVPVYQSGEGRTVKQALALSIFLASAANMASSATYTYNLDSNSGGLRLDSQDLLLWLTDATSAQLVYDDVASTAVISGTMVEKISDVPGADFFDRLYSNVFGTDLWTVNYTYTGVTDLGAGTFEVTTPTGSGTVMNGDGSVTHGLFASSNAAGLYFSLIPDVNDTVIGSGWVNASALPAGSADDFLFTGTLAVMPLPSSAMLILAGLGGLALMRKRK